MSEIEDRRAQVAAQYRAVAYLAKVLAEVHEQMISSIGFPGTDQILDAMGRRSHRIMNDIGDILNGMDAVEEEDAWLDPIFEQARVLFPLDGKTP